MSAVWHRNEGIRNCVCDPDAEVMIRFRNGKEAGPLRAGSRHWKRIPGVSPHAFDIIEWSPV